MAKNSEIAPLLDAVGEELKRLSTSQQQRSRDEAPNFSAFTYIEPDENRLSWIIADLLDPYGVHGQGHVFLGKFLAVLGLTELDASAFTKITLEAQTDALCTERRIDVLLEGKDWLIGIENKPWAADQPKQVEDYLRDLAWRKRSLSYLVYLTRDGREPSAFSIAQEALSQERARGRLILLSFGQVAEWVSACGAICVAPRVKEFLSDFRQYLEEQLLGQTPEDEKKMIVDMVMCSAERLNAALEVAGSLQAIRSALKAKAMTDIQQRLMAGWTIIRRLDGEYGIGLKPPKAEHWHICFEPQRGDYGSWMYGLKRDSLASTPEQSQTLLDLGEKLRLAMPVGAKSSAMWPYYREFRGYDAGNHDLQEYLNWEADTRVWLDIQSGEFAQHIVALANSIVAHLR